MRDADDDGQDMPRHFFGLISKFNMPALHIKELIYAPPGAPNGIYMFQISKSPPPHIYAYYLSPISEAIMTLPHI